MAWWKKAVHSIVYRSREKGETENENILFHVIFSAFSEQTPLLNGTVSYELIGGLMVLP